MNSGCQNQINEPIIKPNGKNQRQLSCSVFTQFDMFLISGIKASEQPEELRLECVAFAVEHLY